MIQTEIVCAIDAADRVKNIAQCAEIMEHVFMRVAVQVALYTARNIIPTVRVSEKIAVNLGLSIALIPTAMDSVKDMSASKNIWKVERLCVDRKKTAHVYVNISAFQLTGGTVMQLLEHVHGLTLLIHIRFNHIGAD